MLVLEVMAAIINIFHLLPHPAAGQYLEDVVEMVVSVERGYGETPEVVDELLADLDLEVVRQKLEKAGEPLWNLRATAKQSSEDGELEVMAAIINIFHLLPHPAAGLWPISTLK
jgi:hypothetical protein